MSGSSVTVETPAKVNLTLEVLGNRPDGYHELRSVVAPISLCDTITVTRLPSGTELSVTAASGVGLDNLGAPERNLAVRVADRLRQRCGYSGGVRIGIVKRIPIGGGLGGGSADAAGTLHALNRLWGLGLATPELMEIGSELGSDIPALVSGRIVLMEGRGEKVIPLDLAGSAFKPLWLVVANPGVACPTPEVYRRWILSPEAAQNNHSRRMAEALASGDAAQAAAALHNGLEPAVLGGWPQVAAAAIQLKNAGCLGVMVSGSGASVFGIAADEKHSREICDQIPRELWHQAVRLSI